MTTTVRLMLAAVTLGCLGGSTTSAPPRAIADAGIALVANQQSADASLIDLRTDSMRLIDVGTGPHEAAISPSGAVGVVTVYGTQTPGNELAIIDTRTATVVRRVSLGEYTRPHGVVFVPGSESRVVVTSETTQRVVLVDIAQGRVEGTIATNAQGSHMVGITRDGRRAFTANIGSATVSEMDLEAKTLVRSIPVGPRAEGIAVAPDGSTVWAGSNTDGTVSVIDTRTGAVVSTLRGFSLPYRIAISADGRTAIVCDPQGDKIHVIDVARRTVEWSLDALGSPRGVTIAPDGRMALVTLNGDRSLGVVDLVARKLVRRIPVGASPDGVGYGPAPR